MPAEGAGEARREGDGADGAALAVEGKVERDVAVRRRGARAQDAQVRTFAPSVSAVGGVVTVQAPKECGSCGTKFAVKTTDL